MKKVKYIGLWLLLCMFLCSSARAQNSGDSSESQLPELPPINVINAPDEPYIPYIKEPLKPITVSETLDDAQGRGDDRTRSDTSRTSGQIEAVTVIDGPNLTKERHIKQPLTTPEVIDSPATLNAPRPALQFKEPHQPTTIQEIDDSAGRTLPRPQEPLQEPKVPDLSNQESYDSQWIFDGAWLPDLDPAQIGGKNYKTLRNLRYKSGKIGLEAVNGYTAINSTALTAGGAPGGGTYYKPRSGAQLRTSRGLGSYTLLQLENAAEDASIVALNSTAIPSTGDFSTSYELSSAGTSYFTDMTGSGLGRFCEAPLESVVYCNGRNKCRVFSGEEARVGAFFTMETANPHVDSEAIDRTNAANNTFFAYAYDYIDIGDDISRCYFLIMTTRRAQAFKFYIKTANAEGGTALDVEYWNGSTFTAVSNLVDNTEDGVGTDTMAQTGTVEFDYTSGAAPYHFKDNYMYAYRFFMNDEGGTPACAGDAEIYHVTADLPMQSIVDLWDGVPRQPIAFQVYRAAVTPGVAGFIDYTLEVNTESFATAPVIAQLDALAIGDYIIIGSEERLSGVYFDMMTSWFNKGTGDFTVSYWNGTAYTAVPYMYDDSTTYPAATGSIQRDGMIWWAPPSPELEAPKLEFGVSGYFYKFTVANAAMTGAYADEDDIMTDVGDVAVDLVTTATAQKVLYPAAFPVQFNNRLLLCNFEGNENRCDYAWKNTTEGWNGYDSFNDGLYSLYFGGPDELTGAKEIYNRYGNDVKTFLTVFKAAETYVLKGDSPEDFTVSRVSANVGCPAPLTIVSAEIAYEVAPDIKRNLLLWLSDSGPYAFDGQFLTPILGIQKYFDPDDPKYINVDYIHKAVGWYDSKYREYNLLLPLGTSTVNNKWLVFSVTERKWFEKWTGTAESPQVGFPVIDTNGVKYIYGGIDSGYLMRLENGPSWADPDGSRTIEQIVETGDFYPTGNIQDYTRIREVWVMAKRIAEDHVITVFHAPNTNDSLASGIWVDAGGVWQDWSGGKWANANMTSIELSMDAGIQRIVRDLSRENLYGWAHRFKFIVKTIDTIKGFQPITWGIRYYREPSHD